MNPVRFAKSKGVSGLVLAFLMIVIPEWSLTWLGIEANDEIILVSRLYGLLSLGGSLAVMGIRKADDFSPWECMSNSVADALAAALLIFAFLTGTINWIGLLLAAGYASNALGFFRWRRVLTNA